MGEESGPSGDEGSGGGPAQQCWGVSCFGSGEVGDERSGFLTPTASHFDFTSHVTSNIKTHIIHHMSHITCIRHFTSYLFYINGWAVCCPRLMQANGKMILTTDYNVRAVPFMLTNGFFVTKLSQRHLVLNFLML